MAHLQRGEGERNGRTSRRYTSPIRMFFLLCWELMLKLCFAASIMYISLDLYSVCSLLCCLFPVASFLTWPYFFLSYRSACYLSSLLYDKLTITTQLFISCSRGQNYLILIAFSWFHYLHIPTFDLVRFDSIRMEDARRLSLAANSLQQAL